MKKMLFDKMRGVADRIERERGLEFFALVHPVDGLYDHWDLLVSSPNLEPHSTAALRYVVQLLQKALTVSEMVRVSRIVVLPMDHDVIQSLVDDDLSYAGRVSAPLASEFDRVFVIRRPIAHHETTVRPGSAM